VTVAGLANMIKTYPAATAQWNLPHIKLARFDGRNVIAKISGIEADHVGTLSIEAAIEIAERAGLRCVICTAPESDGWRIYCPTSCELEPGKRAELVARLNGLFGGILTPESFDRSRSYDYGRTATSSDYRVKTVNINGLFIDEMVELDAKAIFSGAGADAEGRAGLCMGDYALAYVARGWLVFPAPPGHKKSYVSGENTNDNRWGATKDADEAKAYFFEDFPRANIGFPTGPASGFFVVDADTIEGHGVDGVGSLKQLEAEHGPLPETLMAQIRKTEMIRCSTAQTSLKTRLAGQLRAEADKINPPS
jgi:hypothetical protein